MTSKIFTVVQQSQALAVQSKKAESGEFSKCTIVLQELDGQDQYVADMWGHLAERQFQPGDVVAATLQFKMNAYADKVYQNAQVKDIVKVEGLKRQNY